MMQPLTVPSVTCSRPDGSTSAATQAKCAARRSAGTSASWASTSRRFASSSPWPPAQRADSTPGIPFSASTHSPESSATAGLPVCATTARAFSRAFSVNVAPVSATSGMSGYSLRSVTLTSTLLAARMRRSSASFLALRVARIRPASVMSPARRCCSRVSSAHPATPRSSSSSRSSRPNGSRSAVPWTSTKLPSPVHTTFMSVWAATSSS